MTRVNKDDIKLTRVNNDVNGNPRYVVSHLWLVPMSSETPDKYNEAVYQARKIGGTKYRGKDFRGSIVFTSYNTDEVLESIVKIKNS